MLLEVRDLSVARGGVPLLAGLSFAVSAGEALVLRGPNGSGKTTVLRTLAGLQSPIGGEIIGDTEQIAYAGHADGLKATLRVVENLTFWANVFGNRDLVAKAVRAFGLYGLEDRFAGQLSAGQKRRLGLARLVVTGRPVWVLDEPTVSLDTDSVTLFAAAVRKHLGNGGAAIMATHIELGVAARVLDVAKFKAGPAARLGASDEAFL